MAAKKCNCNMGWWIVWLILTTIAIWCLATGFITQFVTGAVVTSATIQLVLPWYFAGLLLFGLGKMAKWKCWGMCNMHSK